MKQRIDQLLVQNGLVKTRSQADSWIRLGKVFVNGRNVLEIGAQVEPGAKIELRASEQYVSRAALKLASVVDALKVDFRNKVVLDVGSSTGGFTDYALQHGAQKVVAVDVGKNQLHPSLRLNKNIELHEQTDIRDVHTISPKPDVVLIDVSFISLREILPHIISISGPNAYILAMVKPQFEAMHSDLKLAGVIKNDHIRRDILKDFESWARGRLVIINKADSSVAGARGNLERFYLLKS
jgi:23S rRNA (cytidine1920-2'-O)/16S rRNA (cytidine1409-2'-O)-methyltransferase